MLLTFLPRKGRRSAEFKSQPSLPGQAGRCCTLCLFRQRPQPRATPALQGVRVPDPLPREFSLRRRRSVLAHFGQSHHAPPPSGTVTHRAFPEHLANTGPCAGRSARQPLPSPGPAVPAQPHRTGEQTEAQLGYVPVCRCTVCPRQSRQPAPVFAPNLALVLRRPRGTGNVELAALCGRNT